MYQNGSLTKIAFNSGRCCPNNIATDCNQFPKYLWFWKRRPSYVFYRSGSRFNRFKGNLKKLADFRKWIFYKPDFGRKCGSLWFLLTCKFHRYRCSKPIKPGTDFSALVFVYHLYRFWQRLHSVFTPHHSPLTLKTPWEEYFQWLLILLVRFLVYLQAPIVQTLYRRATSCCTLRSTSRHKYLTDQALLPYTETKSILEESLGNFKRKISSFSCSDVDIFRFFLKWALFARSALVNIRRKAL